LCQLDYILGGEGRMSYGENKKASLAYLGYAAGSNYTAKYTLASRNFSANGNFS